MLGHENVRFDVSMIWTNLYPCISFFSMTKFFSFLFIEFLWFKLVFYRLEMMSSDEFQFCLSFLIFCFLDMKLEKCWLRKKKRKNRWLWSTKIKTFTLLLCIDLYRTDDEQFIRIRSVSCFRYISLLLYCISLDYGIYSHSSFCAFSPSTTKKLCSKFLKILSIISFTKTQRETFFVELIREEKKKLQYAWQGHSHWTFIRCVMRVLITRH